MERIFIDMDGVLCDFKGHAFKTHNIDLHEDDWPPGVYEMQDVIGMSEEDFWRPINEAGVEWWASLPILPWAHELVSGCESVAKIGISTSPNRSGNSASGKTLWVQHHFPHLARKMMIGPRKEWLARKDTLLIDDSDKKCKRFRKAGGRAIVFPQPWNSMHKMTSDRIKYVFDEMFKK